MVVDSKNAFGFIHQYVKAAWLHKYEKDRIYDTLLDWGRLHTNEDEFHTFTCTWLTVSNLEIGYTFSQDIKGTPTTVLLFEFPHLIRGKKNKTDPIKAYDRAMRGI